MLIGCMRCKVNDDEGLMRYNISKSGQLRGVYHERRCNYVHSPELQKCIYCKQFDHVKNMYCAQIGQFWHRVCRNKVLREGYKRRRLAARAERRADMAYRELGGGKQARRFATKKDGDKLGCYRCKRNDAAELMTIERDVIGRVTNVVHISPCEQDLDPWKQLCIYCRQFDSSWDMYLNAATKQYWHRACRNESLIKRRSAIRETKNIKKYQRKKATLSAEVG